MRVSPPVGSLADVTKQIWLLSQVQRALPGTLPLKASWTLSVADRGKHLYHFIHLLKNGRSGGCLRVNTEHTHTLSTILIWKRIWLLIVVINIFSTDNVFTKVSVLLCFCFLFWHARTFGTFVATFFLNNYSTYAYRMLRHIIPNADQSEVPRNIRGRRKIQIIQWKMLITHYEIMRSHWINAHVA